MQSFYAYIVLCIGCYSALQGGSALGIIPFGLALAVPNIAKPRGQHTLTIETAGHMLNGMAFAAIAHLVGRGIALILGT
jgi:hypothetical protein